MCCSGRCLWDDLKIYFDSRGNIETPPDIIAVNDCGMHIPFPLKHWYSHDARMLPNWASARRPAFKQKDIEKYGKAPDLHSCNNIAQGKKWGWNGQGTSALGAVYTAKGLGYDSIVICGAPLDQSGHYFDAPWIKTNFYYEEPDLGSWRQPAHFDFHKGVKVISGRLLEVLEEFDGSK